MILNFDRGGYDSRARATQCLFMLKDGSISYGPYNLSAFLSHYHEDDRVLAHYRAKLYDRELSDKYAPLEAISAAVKANPELGEEIADYSSRVWCSNPREKEGRAPLTWEKFRCHFEL